jgi:hypothetical protein
MTLECGSHAAALAAGGPDSIDPDSLACFHPAPELVVIPSEARNLLFHVASR